MRYTTVLALALASVCAAEWDLYIGGFSGEEINTLGTDNKVEGLWMDTQTHCSAPEAPFKLKTGKGGAVVFDFCNVNFSVDKYCGGNELYLKGDRCDTTCDTDDECADGSYFADVINFDTGKNIGTCVYHPDWSETCVSNGDTENKELVHCTITGC